MAKQLVVIAGLDKGRVLPMAENDFLQIGRSKSVVIETRLRDPSVARVHCEIEVDGERVVVSDVASPTGTFVNGQRIKQQQLQHNDVVQIGDVQLRFFNDSHSPRAASSTTVPALPVVGEDTAHPPPAVSAARPSASAFSLNLPVGADALKGLTGQTFGAYLVGQVEGSGFYGRVFRARHTRTGKIVALKVIRPDLFVKGEDIARFANVLKPVLPLRHPNLVAYLGAGKTGPYCWLAMEFLPGKSAIQMIRRARETGLLGWQVALRVALHVTQALDFARQHGFYHGSLSAQDILLSGRDLDAKLNDLMLAQALRQPPVATRTCRGEQLEELAMLSPERTQWGVDVDGRADIYSLGATLYGLLTGQMPFDAPTLGELLEQIREESPARLKQLAPAVPDRFEAIVLRMLAKRPEDRYQTPAELLTALEGVAQSHGVTV